jgi:hypothetical protein
MTTIIRIDDEVMNELKKRAVNFGLVFEPPNTTLRRVLGLDEDTKIIIDKIIQEAVAKSGNAGNKVMEVVFSDACRKYVYVPLPKDKRLFFPGYKINFQVETDIGVLTAHVTSAPNAPPIGDPHAGGHIRGKFGPWYRKHPELKDRDNIRIEILEPGKRYRFSTGSKGV